MSKEDDVATAEAQLQQAAAALDAANAEAEGPPAEVVLNKSRAYGTVGGEYFVGETRVRYQQDGLDFDFYGNLVKE